MILIDSSALIEFVAGTAKGREVKSYLQYDILAIPAPVISEVLVGGKKKEKVILRSILDSSEILPFDAEAAYKGVEIEERLLKLRRPIGKTDIFIAAIALAHGLPFLTCDGDFKNVPGLKVILV